LLPPQNATGNWIKVVQRVPVKVSLDAQELAQRPLRIGLSTTVYVDTHNRDGQVLAQTSVPASKPATDVYATDMQQAQAAADAIIARHGGAAH
jgi:membrane fusion protein (multidrug efflux system)